MNKYTVVCALTAAISAALMTLTACSVSQNEQPGGHPESSATGEATVPFVIDQDFPDPAVIEHNGTYYAYATNTFATNVQVATSTDFTTWNIQDDDALPELGEWAVPGKTWAPEVRQLGDTFVLYYTAASASEGVQCIGVATAKAPGGPFVSAASTPLVCDREQGGAIDAGTIVDNGTPYLVFKNDGNCCSKDTWLQLAPLSADGLQLAGDPVRLIKQTEEWEGNLVEAPVIVKHNDTFVLFYSANNYGDERYAIGVATAPELTGPYTKQPKPCLASDSAAGVIGPGGQAIITDANGVDHLLFHGWDALQIYRGMYHSQLTWHGDLPVCSVS